MDLSGENLISNYRFDLLKRPVVPTKMVTKLRNLCLGEMYVIHIPIFHPSLAMTHSYHLKKKALICTRDTV